MDRPLSSLVDSLTLPGHRAIAGHWLTLYRAAQNRVPPLSSLDPLQFPAALPDIWVVNLGEDGRFRFHLLGENMIAWQGGNPKGLSFEDIYPPEMLPVVTAMARRVLEQPAISYQQIMSMTRNWSLPIPIERIGLPMADAEGRHRHLIGVTVFRSRQGHGSGVQSSEIRRDDWFPVAQAEIGAGETPTA